MTTKEIILQAAKQEFICKGFETTRMRSIADKAEVNKGLLHYYFKSKEALVSEIFSETFVALFKDLKRVFTSPSDIFQKIEEGVSVYIDFTTKNQDIPLFIVSEMSRDPKQHIQRMKRLGLTPPFKEMARSIAQSQEEGIIRADITPKQFVLNMISLVLFPVVAKSMVKYMHELNEKEFKEMLEERKKEVAKFLIHAIKA
jgi:TetR/AcrR family transcriptional regulator